MSTELYFAYLLATIVIVIVPGPTVTLIVANSLTHGTRAGLLNVAGTQLGLAFCIGTVAIGLASVIQTIGWWFDWLRLAGAAYLIWIGWKLIRSSGRIDEMARSARKPRGGTGSRHSLRRMPRKVSLSPNGRTPVEKKYKSRFTDADYEMHLWQPAWLYWANPDARSRGWSNAAERECRLSP